VHKRFERAEHAGRQELLGCFLLISSVLIGRDRRKPLLCGRRAAGEQCAKQSERDRKTKHGWFLREKS
jgi:hypothetical protein